MQRFTIFVLFFVITATTASADPRVWDEEGVSIRESYNIAWERVIVRRDNGDHLVIWSDTRNGNRDIFGQYINGDGLPLWNAAGTQLVRMDDVQHQPRACWSGDHFYLCWLDFELSEYRYILWLQKYDLAGRRVWPFNNGLGLSFEPPAISDDPHVSLAPDGAGGVYVGRLGNGGNSARLTIQRVQPDGTPAWAQAMVVADTLGYMSGSVNLTMASNPNGRLFMTWTTSRRSSSANIYAAMLTPAGELPWGNGVNGIPVCLSAGTQKDPQLCLDENGGCFVAWLDERVASERNLYAQHISAAGTAEWTTDGIAVCVAPSARVFPTIAASKIGGTVDGLLAAWEDDRVNNYTREIFAQKIASNGTPLWLANGVRVCGNADEQGGDEMSRPRVITDYEGGALLSWDRAFVDFSSYLNQPFAARLNQNGNFVWGANCEHELDTPGYRHTRPALSYDFRGDPMYFWITAQQGNYRLNVQRLDWTSGNPLIQPDQQTFFTNVFGNPWHPRALEMAGNTAWFWRDERNVNGTRGLYYQILTPGGTPLLEVNGRSFFGNEGRSYVSDELTLADDGNGGGFVIWNDVARQTLEVRMQHILPNGGRVLPDTGVVVWPSSAQWLDQQNQRSVGDGNGGVMVAWGQYDELYYLGTAVMRMDGNGHRLWTEPVHFRPEGEYDVRLRDLVKLSSGDFALLMYRGPFTNFDLYVVALNSAGTVLWETMIADSMSQLDDAQIVADHDDGLFVTWRDRNSSVRAQKVSAAGALLWPAQGVMAIHGANWRSYLRANVSGSGDLWLGCVDGRLDEDLYVQRVRRNGTTAFADSGFALVTSTVNLYEAKFMADGLDGLIVAWTAAYGAEELERALYMTHIDSSGVTVDDYYNGENGGLLGGIGYYGPDFDMVLDRNGAVVYGWAEGAMKEEGSEDYFDVFRVQAQRVVDGHILPSPEPKPIAHEFSLAQNYPNPFNPTTEILYTLPSLARVNLSVYDITGRLVTELVDQVQVAGTHRVTFDASDVSSGVYFYRIQAGQFMSTRKLVVLK